MADVSNKLFTNMSARMAESIWDDLEVTTNVRMKDVEDAQQRIVDIIRDLEERNEIAVLKGGTDDIIVEHFKGLPGQDGKGQCIGIFAGSGVGQSTLMGMIAKNAKANISIIALVGENSCKVLEFMQTDLADERMRRSVFEVGHHRPARNAADEVSQRDIRKVLLLVPTPYW